VKQRFNRAYQTCASSSGNTSSSSLIDLDWM